jgi:hypothetical protein
MLYMLKGVQRQRRRSSSFSAHAPVQLTDGGELHFGVLERWLREQINRSVMIDLT